ncbi:MAG TPA: triose-phosphate isomerase [Gammaproteobacteria bacterium]|jgi:triosephosphate isomerase|nr:triose-phosphate isomerase [Gammaproteobacteria bacterium]
MRRLLIAGNWKMHGSVSQVKTLLAGIKQGAGDYPAIEIVVLPTFVHLLLAHDLLANTPILLGAQNLYVGNQGAFTGEVAGTMLADLGCQYVLIGHSERRSLFHEDLALIAAKFKAAVAAGLKPILCVGETQAQREQDQTKQVITEQIESVIDAAGIQAFRQAVIAYEPVWAIGTGLTATPEQAQTVHAFIRQLFAQQQVDLAATMRILYGGSMKPDNAAALLAMPDVDGGLIGGASLSAESFLQICAAANEVKAHMASMCCSQ